MSPITWGYRENDPMGGYDSYSASKGCAELITSAYRNSFFNLAEYNRKHYTLSCRCGNIQNCLKFYSFMM